MYGGDAWTPVYPAIEYKANQEVAKKAHTLYYDFSKKYGYEDAKPFYNIAQDLGEELNRHNGEKGLIEYYKDDTRLMNFYLEESGKGKIDPIMKEIRTEMTETEIEQSEYTNIIGGEELTWENVYAKSMEIAKWLENKLPEQTVCKNPYAVDILRDIRERGIMLNEKQKEEASYYAGRFLLIVR